MKKRIGILVLCVCLVLAGCTSNMSNTPDLGVIDTFRVVNAIYSMSPYSQLLPREILDGFELTSYQLSESSDMSSVWSKADSPNYSSVSVSKRVRLAFSNKENTRLFVEARVFMDTPSWIVDPNDPETYTRGIFRAEDITPELMEAIMGDLHPWEISSRPISVLCGDWLVCYDLIVPIEGQKISSRQMYDMITSSKYCTDGGDVESASKIGTDLADFAVAEQKRELLYSVTPFEQLLPRKILDEYVVLRIKIVSSRKVATLTLLNEEGIRVEITVDDRQLEDMIAAKDITPEWIETKMEPFSPGKDFYFKVSVLCDDYVVTYRWYPIGGYPNELPISAQEMYDMITSSRYFTE